MDPNIRIFELNKHIGRLKLAHHIAKKNEKVGTSWMQNWGISPNTFLSPHVYAQEKDLYGN